MNKNKVIALLMGKCWHEFGTWGLDYGYVFCKNCRKQVKADQLNPDYFLPADHRELELWLCKEENHDFCRFFAAHCFHQKYKHLHVDDMGLVNTTYFLPFILQGLPSLLIDFLSTETAQERFGWERCPNCVAGVSESNALVIKQCTTCSGSGKIKAPWYEAMEGNDA